MSDPSAPQHDNAPAFAPEQQHAIGHASGEKLRWWVYLAYGAGQCGEGIMGRSLDTFLVFYYSQLLGLPAALVGLTALIGLCVGSGFDIIVGAVSDSWDGAMGRRHPFMYAAVVPFGASFFLIFSAARLTGRSTIVFWLVGSLLLARTALSLYHIPHMAQGAELSDDHTEKTRLAASRSAFSILATFLINIIGFGYIFKSTPAYPDGQMNPSAYFPFAVTFGILITVAILISALATHREIARLHIILSPVGRPSVLSTITAALQIVRLRNYRLMLCETAFYFVAAGSLGSATLYLYTYLWLLKPYDILLVGIAQPIGLLLGFVIVGVLVRHFEKAKVMIMAIGIFMLLQVGPLALKLSGFAPATGTSQLIVMLMVAQGVIGIASLQRISIGASMLADIADEIEYLTWRRQEGLIFAGISICETLSSGIGILVFGLIVNLVGFPRHAVPGSVASVTIDRFIMLIGLETILLCLLAALFLSRLGLTREYHGNLIGQLRDRRGVRVRFPAATANPTRDLGPVRSNGNLGSNGR